MGYDELLELREIHELLSEILKAIKKLPTPETKRQCQCIGCRLEREGKSPESVGSPGVESATEPAGEEPLEGSYSRKAFGHHYRHQHPELYRHLQPIASKRSPMWKMAIDKGWAVPDPAWEGNLICKGCRKE